MKLYESISELELEGSSCLTVGNFDGLHLGHQKIIDTLLRQSQAKNAKSVVFTFTPHPIEFFNPRASFKKIQDQIELRAQLSQLGVDIFVEQKFDESFACLEPGEFLQLLLKHLQPVGMTIGYDFKFGKKQKGDFFMLEDFCQQNSIQLLKEEAFLVGSEIVSSSLIRNKLSTGRILEANQLLGRPFQVLGTVVKGHGRGKTIGFPTVNLKSNLKLFLKPGVYQTQIVIGNKSYSSISNFGQAPTIKNTEELCLETHILNWNESIYGQEVKVTFQKFLRPEMKFDSIESLQIQIAKDLEEVLGNLKPV